MRFQDRLVHIATVLVSITFGCFAQNTEISVLQIDVQNVTLYVNDVTDYSKLATDPGVTTRQASRNFNQFQFIGDIVAVNAKPAKGTWTTTGRSLSLSPAPSSGQAVADAMRGWSANHIFEILQPDGTEVGAITGSGYRQGSVPAGMTVANGTSNFAITGGTGATLACAVKGRKFPRSLPGPHR